jgi:hypothetical protein
MRDPIENALGPPEQIFAYRLSPLDSDDPFEHSPRWRDFNLALHQTALQHLGSYVIEGDVAVSSSISIPTSSSAACSRPAPMGLRSGTSAAYSAGGRLKVSEVSPRACFPRRCWRTSI